MSRVSKHNAGNSYAISLRIALMLSSVLLALIAAFASTHDSNTTRPKESDVERSRTVIEYITVEKEVPVEAPVVVEVEREIIKEIPVPAPVVLPIGYEPNRYSEIPLTENDIDLLAKLAWREARGEKQIGMRLVIETVLNRVLADGKQFPDTVYGVLYQPGQFAPYSGALELDDITPSQAQYDAVYAVLTDTPILDADIYFFATTPLTDNVYLHVGGHYFCGNGNWNN